MRPKKKKKKQRAIYLYIYSIRGLEKGTEIDQDHLLINSEVSNANKRFMAVFLIYVFVSLFFYFYSFICHVLGFI